MLGEIDYLKILDYSNRRARVYFVSKDHSMANIFNFIKENDEWIVEGWASTIWSQSGSASEVIWPYWWHFIYGGL